MVSDKDLAEILPLFPKSANYYFVAPNIKRALSAEDLKNQAQTFGLKGDSFPSVSSGLSAAKEVALSDELVFVGGSTFTVAEIV